MEKKKESSRRSNLNDQEPKPLLGNSPLLHGKVNTDNAGGPIPSRKNHLKVKKGS